MTIFLVIWLVICTLKITGAWLFKIYGFYYSIFLSIKSEQLIHIIFVHFKFSPHYAR